MSGVSSPISLGCTTFGSPFRSLCLLGSPPTLSRSLGGGWKTNRAAFPSPIRGAQITGGLTVSTTCKAGGPLRLAPVPSRLPLPGPETPATVQGANLVPRCSRYRPGLLRRGNEARRSGPRAQATLLLPLLLDLLCEKTLCSVRVKLIFIPGFLVFAERRRCPLGVSTEHVPRGAQVKLRDASIST